MRLNHLLLALIVLAWAVAVGCSPSKSAMDAVPVTLILGALDKEAAILETHLADKQEMSVRGLQATRGVLNGRRVVIALSGVGKVNASMTASLLIDHVKPAEVVFTGLAGGLNPELHMGDVVIGLRLAQHDLVGIEPDRITRIFPRDPVTGIRTPEFFSGNPRLIALTEQAAEDVIFEPVVVDGYPHEVKVVKGTIVTGDQFIASEAKREQLRRDFGADATEMEGAAVAAVCESLKVPCLVIRSLSDLAGAKANDQFVKFLPVAAANSSQLTMRLLALLAESHATSAKSQ